MRASLVTCLLQRNSSIDTKQLHFEHQRGIRGNHSTGAARAVRKRRRNDELAETREHLEAGLVSEIRTHRDLRIQQ